jgi:ABC-type uncharacterized transport system substrate-binding protein
VVVLALSLQHALATTLAPLESTDWLEKPVSVGEIGANSLAQMSASGDNVYGVSDAGGENAIKFFKS